MNLSPSIRPLLAIACATSLGLSSMALAQPEAGPTQGQMLSAEARHRELARAWDELRREVGEQEITEPQKAIARYQEFFEARGSKDAKVGVAISLAIARLYRIELRDKDKALEIYNWTLQQYAASPAELEPVQRERDALLKAAQDAPAIPNAIRITGAAPDAPKSPGADALSPVRITGETKAAADAPAPIQIRAGVVGASNPFAPKAPQVLAGPKASGSPGSATSAGIAEKIKAGTLSPAAAYANGALTIDEAIEMLARMGQADEHQGMAALVIAHGADRLQKPGALPLKARLWLGDALAMMGDDRALRLLESVVAELQPPVKGFSSQWLLWNSIERLALFHSARKQHEKAAQTWLRVEPLLGEPNWMAPASLLGAALALSAGGQQVRSRELLGRVPGFGVSWLSGLARFDAPRARSLAAQIIQAREFLEQAGVVGGEARANALALLSYAHRLAGDWKAARSAADAAIKYLEALPLEKRAESKGAQALARETWDESSKRLEAAR